MTITPSQGGRKEKVMYDGDKQEAKVNIMTALKEKGWTIYGYRPDTSDMMTDYFNPAHWDGVADRNGFVVCVGVYDNRYSGSADGNEKSGTVSPAYQANPKGRNWHVEKDGEIIASGCGAWRCHSETGLPQEEIDANIDKLLCRIEKAIAKKEKKALRKALTTPEKDSVRDEHILKETVKEETEETEKAKEATEMDIRDCEGCGELINFDRGCPDCDRDNTKVEIKTLVDIIEDIDYELKEVNTLQGELEREKESLEDLFGALGGKLLTTKEKRHDLSTRSLYFGILKDHLYSLEPLASKEGSCDLYERVEKFAIKVHAHKGLVYMDHDILVEFFNIDREVKKALVDALEQ